MTKTERIRIAYRRMLNRSVRMPNGCLEYQGATTAGGGYPVIRVGDTIMRGNRVALIAERGPLRKHQLALHSCDNTRCVDIDHLRAGTHRENMNEMRIRRRSAAGEHGPGAKLTAAQVAEIRIRYFTEQITQRELGDEYGVTDSTVCRVLARRTFAA